MAGVKAPRGEGESGMHRYNGFDLAARPPRRWVKWLRRLLALAVLCAAVPVLRAAAPALRDGLAACLAPGWAAERQVLESENAALREELAAAADLQTENAALRALLHSPVPRPAALCPARALAHSGAGVLLWCDDESIQPGAAVLDRCGRFAGRAAAVRGLAVWVPSPEGEACFVGEDPALLHGTAAGWCVTGLPVPAAARKGALVTTPEGHWLGRLAADPTPEQNAGGLTASAPLTDTAKEDSRYFVAQP